MVPGMSIFLSINSYTPVNSNIWRDIKTDQFFNLYFSSVYFGATTFTITTLSIKAGN
jgi:hypothetical protein